MVIRQHYIRLGFIVAGQIQSAFFEEVTEASMAGNGYIFIESLANIMIMYIRWRKNIVFGDGEVQRAGSRRSKGFGITVGHRIRFGCLKKDSLVFSIIIAAFMSKRANYGRKLFERSVSA